MDLLMRSLTIAIALLLAMPPTLAQVARAKSAAAKSAKQRAVVPSVQQTYASLPLNERLAIQSDLVWTGDYNGLIDGEFSQGAINAVKAFQKRNQGKEIGVLNLPERALLAAAAKPAKDHVGWRIIADPVTGARLGLPSSLVPQASTTKSGSRWSSAQGQIQVETFRAGEPGTTLQAVFEQQKREPSERKVGYQVLKPDFFVISGTQSLKKFYVRGQIKDGEVRGMAVLYDPATELLMDPVVVAMSSAFAPFADTGQAPLRRNVDYGSGIVASSTGDILVDRELTEGCQVIVVAGLGNAERLADDKSSGLALLRVYGVRELKPIAFAATSPAEAGVTIVGVADPQAQGGGGETSSVAARLATEGSIRLVDPAPALGFSGAAILDAQQRLIGMVTLRPSVVAGAAPARSQAPAITIDAIRQFAEANQVPLPERAAGDGAKDSILRIICVRK
jgi:peptidoglycan hydrolase-like protein with peptidoglycan-binding domain